MNPAPICKQIPWDLLVPCDMPERQGDTWGDVFEYTIRLQTALKKCNQRIESLEQANEALCPSL